MEAWLRRHCPAVATPFADVRLRRVDLLEAHAVHAGLAALLSTDERARAALYRFAADRDRFVVTRAVLRLVLAEAGLGPPECLTLVAGPYGKPELSHPSALRFNVAHSGDVALIALADAREVGVDVEQARPRHDLLALATRFFTPAEAAAIAPLDGEALTSAFHRCWVRKEACVKASGLGLRVAFDTFEVGVATEPPVPRHVQVAEAGTLRGYALADVDVPAGYAGALAVATG